MECDHELLLLFVVGKSHSDANREFVSRHFVGHIKFDGAVALIAKRIGEQRSKRVH